MNYFNRKIREFYYRYCCVDCYSNKIKELEYIIDNSREISYQTFVKNVNKEEFDSLVDNLGYEKDSRFGLTLKKDWHVSYYKSKLPNKKPVYYLRHSSIEYIFY